MNTRIEQMREFIARCPFMDVFSTDHIDWTDAEPGNYGIMPTGQSVIRTEEDIYGNKVKYFQENFAVYAMFFTINDIVRLESAGFLEQFTDWIDNQSESSTAPQFGDDAKEEYMTAQNGMLFQISDDGTTGRYQIQINCNYVKHYERNDF